MKSLWLRKLEEEKKDCEEWLSWLGYFPGWDNLDKAYEIEKQTARLARLNEEIDFYRNVMGYEPEVLVEDEVDSLTY